MRKLVILGNGFDLSHGINSKYEHFIVNYLYKLNKKECDSDSENISFFYQEYSNDLIHLKTKTWTDCGLESSTSENIDKSNWYNNFKNKKTEDFQGLWKQLENYEIIVNNKNETSLLNEIIELKSQIKFLFDNLNALAKGHDQYSPKLVEWFFMEYICSRLV